MNVSARHRGLVLGVTGSAGSGKSTVTRMLAAMGAQTADADALVRWAYADAGFRKEIESRFGSGVIKEDGSVDRAALAEIVFGDADALASLEAIVHPAVLDQMSQMIDVYRGDSERAPLLALEIPLLYEGGAEAMVDKVLAVSAPADVRSERLASRGWSSARIAAVEQFQMPPEEKEARADFVVQAEGSPADTAVRVEQLWRQLIA